MICWRPIIAIIDANLVLNYLTGRDRNMQLMRTLLEAALCQSPAFLTLRDIYNLTMEFKLYDIAEKVIRIPKFSVNLHSAAPVVGFPPKFDLPLHTAISHHATKLIEILMARGATVNCMSYGVSPLSPVI